MPPLSAEQAALLNTSLILTSGLFLVAGYILIRRRHVARHRAAMLAAATFAALFLVVYIWRYLTFAPKVFAGEGAVRALYLLILGTHTVLAVVVGPLVLVTLARALRGQWTRHRRIARITFPVWLYVVLSGWTVYLMLHTIA